VTQVPLNVKAPPLAPKCGWWDLGTFNNGSPYRISVVKVRMRSLVLRVIVVTACVILAIVVIGALRIVHVAVAQDTPPALCLAIVIP
jgi:hypothetical protein